jgi:hypothetical protein
MHLLRQQIEEISSLTMKNLSMSYLILKSKQKKHQFLIQEKRHCKMNILYWVVKIYHVDSNGKNIVQFATQITDFQAYFNKTNAILFRLYRRLRITIITLENREKTFTNCIKSNIFRKI